MSDSTVGLAELLGPVRGRLAPAVGADQTDRLHATTHQLKDHRMKDISA